jgi:hypothetical protein
MVVSSTKTGGRIIACLIDAEVYRMQSDSFISFFGNVDAEFRFCKCFDASH